MKTLTRILLVVIYLTLAASPASAQSESSIGSEGEAWQTRINAALRAEESIIKQLYESESAEYRILTDLKRLNNLVVDTRRRIRTMESEIVSLESGIQSGRQQLDRRLRYIYRMRGGNLVRMLLRSQSISDFLRRWRAVKLIVREDRRRIREYQQRVSELTTVKSNLKENLERVVVIKSDAERKGRLAMGERKKRLYILGRIKEDKKLAEAAARELNRDRKDSTEMILQMTKPESLQPENGLSILDFGMRKGYLETPVKGPVIGFFGPVRNARLGTVTRNNGIDILASEGTPVVAVASGRVRFAGEFMGYGRVVIIDHGHRYHTMYGHLDRTQCVKGQAVDEGEVIGAVGSTSSLSGPQLHFEIRFQGNAVNPMNWLLSQH